MSRADDPGDVTGGTGQGFRAVSGPTPARSTSDAQAMDLS
jgi:hypothetical protein